jgi:hypothetical protein
MRRWIFAALVLANLGVFLWGIQYIEPERPAQIQAYEEINSDKMRLLSEVPQGKLVPRPKPAPPPPPIPTVDGLACYRIGPLAEATQVKTVEDALQKQSLAFTRRDESITTVAGYRVFLPPFASKEQAEQKRRELTQLGFSDHAVMQEEGYRNAVSLGLFAVEANAQSHLRRLVQVGVVATIQPIQQKRNVTWLELHPNESADQVSGRLKAVLETAPGMDVVQIPCPASFVPQPIVGPTNP